jgi:ribA/ribD-fused uncharacterized protein
MGGPGIINGKEYYCVDNFQKCKFMLDDKEYCSSENYFQSQKATNEEDFEKIRKSGPGMECYSLGGKIELRSDWEKVKVEVMYIGNKAKFEQNKKFAKELTSSTGKIVFEQSTFFWNLWNGIFIFNYFKRINHRKN